MFCSRAPSDAPICRAETWKLYWRPSAPNYSRWAMIFRYITATGTPRRSGWRKNSILFCGRFYFPAHNFRLRLLVFLFKLLFLWCLNHINSNFLIFNILHVERASGETILLSPPERRTPFGRFFKNIQLFYYQIFERSILAARTLFFVPSGYWDAQFSKWWNLCHVEMINERRSSR